MEHRLVVHFFSQRTSSRRKRLIQEWVVRPSIAVPGIPESMPSLTARTQVKNVSQLGHLFPNDRMSYPLSGYKYYGFFSSGSGLGAIASDSAVLNIFISWRFAPSTTTPSIRPQTPFRATLAAIRRIRSRSFSLKRSLDHGSAHCLPGLFNTFKFIVRL